MKHASCTVPLPLPKPEMSEHAKRCRAKIQEYMDKAPEGSLFKPFGSGAAKRVERQPGEDWEEDQ